MSEVPRLVSDSPCSSVLLSDGVLPLSAGCGAAGTTMATGAGMSMLGVTWNRPTVTGADCTSEAVEEAFGLELLAFISGTGGCNLGLKDDKVFSGVSGGDGERSDEFELETSDLGVVWAGTWAENGAT